MDVHEYLESLDEPRRSDLRAVHECIARTMPHLDCVVAPPMIGYGPYRFRYASGREGDWYKIAVANRKTGISIHVMAIDESGYLVEQFKERLPKAKVGKGCVVVKRADDLDFEVMAELVHRAEEMGYPFAVS